MECLNNLIGISPILGDNPSSGLFLSDIDITIKQGNDLQNQNHTSGVDYLRQKIAFAQKSIVQDVLNRLRESQPNLKAFGVNTVLESFTIGKYRENKPVLNANNLVLRGLLFEANNAEYLTLNVTSVSLMAQTTGSINVEVWDLIQSKLIDTIAVEGIAGEISTTQVNKSYPNNGQQYQIAFLYNGAVASYINDYNAYAGCLSCVPKCSQGQSNWTGATILKASNKIKSSITTGGQRGANGLSIAYTLDCDANALVCQIKGRLAMPLLYKTALLTLDTYRTTARINSTVKIPNSPIEDVRVFMQEQYEKNMDNIIQGIQLPNTACFKCLPRVRQTVVLP